MQHVANMCCSCLFLRHKLAHDKKVKEVLRIFQQLLESSSQILAEFFKKFQYVEIANCQQLSALPYCYGVPTLSLYSVGTYAVPCFLTGCFEIQQVVQQK